MKLENEFTVPASLAEAWSLMLDVERVAPCMPGAEVLEQVSDDLYRVAVSVKVGPISMRYRGDVEVEERDDAARRATLRVKAKEARGQGTADAHVRMALASEPDGTHATMETEVALSGRAAAMGRGVIADVSARLVETFASNLAQMLESTPAPVDEPAPSVAAPTSHNGQAPTEHLAAGRIAFEVVEGRLREPRALLGAAAAVALAGGALGYLVGRHR